MTLDGVSLRLDAGQIPGCYPLVECCQRQALSLSFLSLEPVHKQLYRCKKYLPTPVYQGFFHLGPVS